MKKIIVFGATGLIGAYFVDYCKNNLNSSDYELIAVGKRQTDFFSKQGIKYYSIDISQAEQFEQLDTEDVHAVVLLAAMIPASMKGYDPVQYFNSNIMGAYNVLEYCRNKNVDRIIYTQTLFEIGKLYGSDKPLRPLGIDMPRCFSYTGDHSVYVISKNAAVDLVEHYHQEYGIKSFIFRLPTIYAYSPNEYYYVNGVRKIQGYRHMINQSIAGEPIEMWGDPTKAHDFVYVKDFCQMLGKAIAINRDKGFYNVGTGVPVSLKEQIEGMVEVFSPKDRPSVIVPCPNKPSARSYTLDISNARKELGYKPQYDYLSYLNDFKREMELKRFEDLFVVQNRNISALNEEYKD